MPEPQKLIVGREAEIELFKDFVTSQGPEFILNIFGPGGIGKTEVCEKLTECCRHQGWLYASVQGDSPSLSFDRILYQIKEELITEPSGDSSLDKHFKEFEKRLSEYLIVQDVLERGGGFAKLFDSVGNVVPDLLKMVTGMGKAVEEELRRKFRNRYALQQYMNSAERWLAESLAEGITGILGESSKPIVLLIDSYEKLSLLDEWVCETLVRTLPSGIRIVLSGRDRVQDMGFHWKEYADQILSHELLELEKQPTYAYLRHYGLKDPRLLDDTYAFTGGYPLCLVLAVELSRKIGWEQVAGFQRQTDRYEVARQLLDRILEQEEVKEVREFLEKGVVTLWFDVEAIAYVLDIPPEQAERIYSRISRFSFTQRHEFGLKFHDKVRDLLLERLSFMDRKLYEGLLHRWRDYYKSKVEKGWLLSETR